MQQFISIFEIPVTDMARAIRFYEAILDIKIEEVDMEGVQMGVFPGDDQVVSGVLACSPYHTPSTDGVVVYLNGGDDLQLVLDKVTANNGAVVAPKTPISPEMGYFAMFIDSEGNRLGLHSPN